MRYTLALALAAATALDPPAAHAQTEATQAPVARQQVLSTNPFGDLARWLNVEYERKIGPATTLGVAASTLLNGDYASASLMVRWYPQGAALEGFYLGARADAHRAASKRLDEPVVLPGVGVEIGHAWLFGSNRRVSLSIGLELTHVFGNPANSDDHPPAYLPTARLANVGIAF